MATRLAVLLLVSELLYLDLFLLDAVNGWRPVGRFLFDVGLLFAAYLAASRMLAGTRGSSGWRVMSVIFAGAVLFRVTLFPAGLSDSYRQRDIIGGLTADLTGRAVSYQPFLLFDSDIWRYLWEGHAAAHGASPFRYSPGHPAVDPLAGAEPAPDTDRLSIWAEVRSNVTHPDLTTIYPPAAQALFRLSHHLAPASVLMMKLLVTVLDLGAAVLLVFCLQALGQPASFVLLYAWNPLAVKVFAGSGHYDALVIALLAGMTLAVLHRRAWLASAALGISVLAKLAPVVLFPFLFRRGGWPALIPGVALIAAGMAAVPGGLSSLSGYTEFARFWRFNGGPYLLLEGAAGPSARYLAAALLLVALGWLYHRDAGTGTAFAAGGAAALGATLLLSPVVNPWYVTWILPFAVLARQWFWLLFSALVCLSFLVMVDGRERHWVLWVEYAALVPASFWLRRSGSALPKFVRKGDRE